MWGREVTRLENFRLAGRNGMENIVIAFVITGEERIACWPSFLNASPEVQIYIRMMIERLLRVSILLQPMTDSLFTISLVTITSTTRRIRKRTGRETRTTDPGIVVKKDRVMILKSKD